MCASNIRDHGTRTVNAKELNQISCAYTIIENYIIMSAGTSASVLMKVLIVQMKIYACIVIKVYIMNT